MMRPNYMASFGGIMLIIMITGTFIILGVYMVQGNSLIEKGVGILAFIGVCVIIGCFCRYMFTDQIEKKDLLLVNNAI